MVENVATRGSPALLLMALTGLAALALWAARGALEAAPEIVAPSYDQIRWGEHAWESHADDADRALDHLKICGPASHAYFCPSKGGYFVYVCQFPGRPDLCAGAIVGRTAIGFTVFVAPCSFWFQKVESCAPATMAQ